MLTFHEINLLMQTLWTSLAVTSIWLRAKGRYVLHEVTMAIVVGAALISFTSVLLMSPLSGGSLSGYFSTPLRTAVFSVHGSFAVAALASGVLLVALWRPHSRAFLAKTDKIAKAAPYLWVLAYAAGVLAFIVYQTTLL